MQDSAKVGNVNAMVVLFHFYFPKQNGSGFLEKLEDLDVNRGLIFNRYHSMLKFIHNGSHVEKCITPVVMGLMVDDSESITYETKNEIKYISDLSPKNVISCLIESTDTNSDMHGLLLSGYLLDGFSGDSTKSGTLAKHIYLKDKLSFFFVKWKKENKFNYVVILLKESKEKKDEIELFIINSGDGTTRHPHFEKKDGSGVLLVLPYLKYSVPDKILKDSMVLEGMASISTNNDPRHIHADLFYDVLLSKLINYHVTSSINEEHLVATTNVCSVIKALKLLYMIQDWKLPDFSNIKNNIDKLDDTRHNRQTSSFLDSKTNNDGIYNIIPYKTFDFDNISNVKEHSKLPVIAKEMVSDRLRSMPPFDAQMIEGIHDQSDIFSILLKFNIKRKKPYTKEMINLMEITLLKAPLSLLDDELNKKPNENKISDVMVALHKIISEIGLNPINKNIINRNINVSFSRSVAVFTGLVLYWKCVHKYFVDYELMPKETFEYMITPTDGQMVNFTYDPVVAFKYIKLTEYFENITKQNNKYMLGNISEILKKERSLRVIRESLFSHPSYVTDMGNNLLDSLSINDDKNVLKNRPEGCDKDQLFMYTAMIFWQNISGKSEKTEDETTVETVFFRYLLNYVTIVFNTIEVDPYIYANGFYGKITSYFTTKEGDRRNDRTYRCYPTFQHENKIDVEGDVFDYNWMNARGYINKNDFILPYKYDQINNNNIENEIISNKNNLSEDEMIVLEVTSTSQVSHAQLLHFILLNKINYSSYTGQLLIDYVLFGGIKQISIANYMALFDDNISSGILYELHKWILDSYRSHIVSYNAHTFIFVCTVAIRWSSLIHGFRVLSDYYESDKNDSNGENNKLYNDEYLLTLLEIRGMLREVLTIHAGTWSKDGISKGYSALILTLPMHMQQHQHHEINEINEQQQLYYTSPLTIHQWNANRIKSNVYDQYRHIEIQADTLLMHHFKYIVITIYNIPAPELKKQLKQIIRCNPFVDEVKMEELSLIIDEYDWNLVNNGLTIRGVDTSGQHYCDMPILTPNMYCRVVDTDATGTDAADIVDTKENNTKIKNKIKIKINEKIQPILHVDVLNTSYIKYHFYNYGFTHAEVESENALSVRISSNKTGMDYCVYIDYMILNYINGVSFDPIPRLYINLKNKFNFMEDVVTEFGMNENIKNNNIAPEWLPLLDNIENYHVWVKVKKDDTKDGSDDHFGVVVLIRKYDGCVELGFTDRIPQINKIKNDDTLYLLTTWADNVYYTGTNIENDIIIKNDLFYFENNKELLKIMRKFDIENISLEKSYALIFQRYYLHGDMSMKPLLFTHDNNYNMVWEGKENYILSKEKNNNYGIPTLLLSSSNKPDVTISVLLPLKVYTSSSSFILLNNNNNINNNNKHIEKIGVVQISVKDNKLNPQGTIEILLLSYHMLVTYQYDNAFYTLNRFTPSRKLNEYENKIAYGIINHDDALPEAIAIKMLLIFILFDFNMGVNMFNIEQEIKVFISYVNILDKIPHKYKIIMDIPSHTYTGENEIYKKYIEDAGHMLMLTPEEELNYINIFIKYLHEHESDKSFYLISLTTRKIALLRYLKRYNDDDMNFIEFIPEMVEVTIPQKVQKHTNDFMLSLDSSSYEYKYLYNNLFV
eukprot:GHVR01120591.1.p1 GENE.GHVR01120591.1~~GHVR01120591.1.p1  ORF type:complete len:1700 (+),score=419.22 GHVR01120591.1:205-5100(+)